MVRTDQIRDGSGIEEELTPGHEERALSDAVLLLRPVRRDVEHQHTLAVVRALGKGER